MRFQYCIAFLAGLLQLVHSQAGLPESPNYLIRYCPADKTAQLQAFLPVFRKHIQTVAADVPRGIRSKAYGAFFKSPANVENIHRVFQRMAAGDVILVPGKEDPLSRLHLPSLICLDPSVPNVEGLDAVCDDQTLAAVVPDRELVVLCDEFWKIADLPAREQCPRVRRNYYIPNDHRIILNKFGTLVHQFAHAYLSNWNRDFAYDPMDAARRSKQDSLTNPNNYALYASSKSFACFEICPLFITDGFYTVLVAGCEEYVNPNALRRFDDDL
ncbi:MAG: hypothetical protein Q9216_006109 [Gyalolechia sp. 2 TL-2023]